MSSGKKRKKGRVKTLFGRLCFDMRAIDIKWAIIGAVCVLAGGFVSYFAGGSPTYILRMLNMPSGLPTRWFFKLSWTLTYILLGAAFGAVLGCKERCKEIHKYQGSMFFVIMCLFNFIWYPLFFGAEAIFLALVCCAVMIVLDYFVFCNYFKVNLLCGSITFFHLFWLLYMFCLNAAVLFIN